MTTGLCYFIKMKIKNPNKNNELKALIEVLKSKKLITKEELSLKKIMLKSKKGEIQK